MSHFPSTIVFESADKFTFVISFVLGLIGIPETLVLQQKRLHTWSKSGRKTYTRTYTTNEHNTDIGPNVDQDNGASHRGGDNSGGGWGEEGGCAGGDGVLWYGAQACFVGF